MPWEARNNASLPSTLHETNQLESESDITVKNTTCTDLDTKLGATCTDLEGATCTDLDTKLGVGTQTRINMSTYHALKDSMQTDSGSPGKNIILGGNEAGRKGPDGGKEKRRVPLDQSSVIRLAENDANVVGVKQDFGLGMNSMCLVYMYVCVCVCLCVHICVCIIYMYICMYVCIYICMYVCILCTTRLTRNECVWIRVCVYVVIHVCVYVRIRVCVHVFIPVCVYVAIHVLLESTYLHTYTQTHIIRTYQTHIRTYMHESYLDRTFTHA
jgi:hypothetical protein